MHERCRLSCLFDAIVSRPCPPYKALQNNGFEQLSMERARHPNEAHQFAQILGRPVRPLLAPGEPFCQPWANKFPTARSRVHSHR
jgi:hypothetical protein